MYIRWMTVTGSELHGMTAEQAALHVTLKAARMAKGCDHTLGAMFRNGKWWANTERYYPVIIEADGRDEPVPFDLPPRAIFLDRPGLHSPDWMMSEGMKKMQRGDWLNGWRLYEWRLQTPHGRQWWSPYESPAWAGQPLLPGKKLLVHAEQGIGDCIQFMRYLPLIGKVQGARVDFLCSTEFEPIARRLTGFDGRIVTVIDEHYDYHTSLCSLPLMLELSRPFAETFYLKSMGIPFLKAGMSDIRGKTGICWKGSDKHPGDAQRSMTRAQLLRYAGCTEDQTVDLTWDGKRTWWDTMEMVSALGQVVSVDTAVAHLAAAMGKRTKIIMSRPREWRWGPVRQHESMWYENAWCVDQEEPNEMSNLREHVA